ncbi:MAG: hypothetical protein V1790_09200 [Planctomycetota bacterium]
MSLTDSIRDLEKRLAESERKDERVARLKTMPKVGRIAALTFVAAVDERVLRTMNGKPMLMQQPTHLVVAEANPRDLGQMGGQTTG